MAQKQGAKAALMAQNQGVKAEASAKWTPQDEQATRCPIANVVGKWKDIHLEQTQRSVSETSNVVPDGVSLLGSPGRNYQESEPERVLRVPEFQGHRAIKDADLHASMDKCSQTIAWLAETMVEERLHTKTLVRRLENLLDNLQIEREQTASDITEAKWSDASGIHTQVSEEFKAHRAWVANKFVNLRSLLVHQQEEFETHVKDVKDVGQTLPAAPNYEELKPQTTEVVSGMSDYTEDKTHDKPAANNAAAPKSTARGSITSAASSLYERCMDSEHARLEQYVMRMKSSIKCRNPILHLIDGMSEKQLSRFKRKPTSCMVDLVESQVFSGCSLAIVLLNAAWIGYQTQIQMTYLMHPAGPQEFPKWHNQVKRLFSIVFTIEIIIRLATYRLYFFTCIDKAWNLYDLLVVLGALFEELFETMNWNFLRAFRVIRMVRVTRMIRVLRFFQSIRYLMVSLLASTMMLMWTFLFLIFLMYLFAIIFMQGVIIWIDTSNDLLLQSVAKYYGSLSRTMFTLMLAVTGGKPWHEFLEPLSRATPALVPVFIVYMVVVLYGILNVVNAVFVEHTSELKKRDRDLAVHQEMATSEAFGAQLRAFYEELGLCNNDMIDRETFVQMLENSEVQMFLQTHGIDVSEAEELFSLLDAQGGGYIAVDDFVFGCQRLKGTAKSMDVVLLYEQMQDLKGQIVRMSDKQVSINEQVRRATDRMIETMYHITTAVRELSGDMKDSTIVRRRQSELI